MDAVDLNRDCLSWWFPILEQHGLPVPQTSIVHTDARLVELLDGRTPDGYENFLDELFVKALLMAGARRYSNTANDAAACPLVFLRTGVFSGKHDWKRCCFADLNRARNDGTVDQRATLAQHVYNLVEMSHMVSMMGLPTHTWCVRELLPTQPVAVLPRYGDMPVVTELRYFVNDGKVACCHPYWPLEAIRDGMQATRDLRDHQILSANLVKAQAYYDLAQPSLAQRALADELAQRVAQAFASHGAWSVDVLLTARGWYVTDMAGARQSFHWPGCVHEQAFGAPIGL